MTPSHDPVGDVGAATEMSAHLASIPHSVALGMKLVSHTGDECVLSMPYNEALIGDPDNGVIHGGALTALLDNAAGFVARPPDGAVGMAIATLDMRIDYMGPATPGRTIIARALCIKRTTNVAFIQGLAYHDSPDEPIASCTAAFMLGTPNTPGAT